jgi:phenylalanyl-tRNA synthetase alpha chain
MKNPNSKNINEKKILQELEKKISQVVSVQELNQVKKEYLGKKGVVRGLFNNIKQLSSEEKRKLSPPIQKIQKKVSYLIDEKEEEIKKEKIDLELKEQEEKLIKKTPKIGHLHPITQTIRMLNSVFEDMGYSIMDGPELETDEYCFRRLNVPPNHPARDMQDTIYIESPKFLLRTQTSSIEAHLLEDQKPPFKVVCPGRVYRNEKPNKSNHFIFHHYQGVVVMEKVTLKDLFGTINHLFKAIYGSQIEIRLRNKYYPEVEPGVGADMLCFHCKGKGCFLCKNVGWIEMGGAGIIHPNVLKMAGVDRKKWMGFAFGLGLDRWVMAKYGISDIRTLLGEDLTYKYYENENTL